jgi:hypothetical protein
VGKKTETKKFLNYKSCCLIAIKSTQAFYLIAIFLLSTPPPSLSHTLLIKSLNKFLPAQQPIYLSVLLGGTTYFKTLLSYIGTPFAGVALINGATKTELVLTAVNS